MDSYRVDLLGAETRFIGRRYRSWDKVRQRLGRILADPAALPAEAVAVRHRRCNDPALNAARQAFVMSFLTGDRALAAPSPDESGWRALAGDGR